jgi:serine/threonine protein kinase
VFNQPYGKEVDFYSLGMILYNILLKKFPYDANTREELKNQMETQSPTILIKELPL